MMFGPFGMVIFSLSSSWSGEAFATARLNPPWLDFGESIGGKNPYELPGLVNVNKKLWKDPPIFHG
jgi:hypothetical protein